MAQSTMVDGRMRLPWSSLGALVVIEKNDTAVTSVDKAASRMNLAHLKTFHHVAQSGSFTQAAQRLFLTQPAVSLQIQGLEHALRVSLFNRTRRRITLTSEGLILYGYTQRLFGLFEEIEHVFQDLNHLQSGSLTVAASAFMGTYYLSELVTAFNKRYPRIRFRIRTGNSQQVVDWVVNQDVDLGFSGRVTGYDSLRQMLVHSEPYVCVTAPQTQWHGLGRALSAEEFINAFMVVREKGTRTRAKIEEWMREHASGRHLRPLITTHSLESCKRLVANGFGVCAMPQLAVADALQAGSLVTVEVQRFSISADYYLTYSRERQLSAAALQRLMLLKEDAGKSTHGTVVQAPQIHDDDLV